MKKLTNYSFSAEAKRFVHIIIYIIFLCYSIYLIVQAPLLSAKIVYTIITIVFLSIAVFSEFLEYLSESAIKALSYQCDPEKACILYDKIDRLDFFRSYRKNRVLFDTLYNLAVYEPTVAIDLIQNNDKYFRSNIDALFIRNVSLFIAYIEMDNKTQAKKAYPDIVKLKGAKVKGKKLSPLYSWEELEALNHYISNEFDKACRSYQTVNTKYMNNKEKTQVYLYYYKSLMAIKSFDKAAEVKLLLEDACNKLPIHKQLEV